MTRRTDDGGKGDWENRKKFAGAKKGMDGRAFYPLSFLEDFLLLRQPLFFFSCSWNQEMKEHVWRVAIYPGGFAWVEGCAACIHV